MMMVQDVVQEKNVLVKLILSLVQKALLNVAMDKVISALQQLVVFKFKSY